MEEEKVLPQWWRFIFLWSCTSFMANHPAVVLNNCKKSHTSIKSFVHATENKSIKRSTNTNSSSNILEKLQLQKCHKAENWWDTFFWVISARNFPELYLNYKSAAVAVSAGHCSANISDWSLSEDPGRRKNVKTLLMLKAFPLSWIKSLFFLPLPGAISCQNKPLLWWM